VIPSTVLGLFLFIGALSPGFVFVRHVERRQAREQRSQLSEVAELVFVGSLTTVCASILTLCVVTSQGWLDIQRLRADSETYLLDHPVRALWPLLAIMILSIGFAWLLAQIFVTDAPTIYSGPLWDALFGPSDEQAKQLGVDQLRNRATYATIELRSGRGIRGQVAGYDLGRPGDGRELALAQPLEIREDGAEKYVTLYGSNVVVVTSSDIQTLSLSYYETVPPAD
jgi:hypothetical protein